MDQLIRVMRTNSKGIKVGLDLKVRNLWQIHRRISRLTLGTLNLKNQPERREKTSTSLPQDTKTIPKMAHKMTYSFQIKITNRRPKELSLENKRLAMKINLNLQQPTNLKTNFSTICLLPQNI